MTTQSLILALGLAVLSTNTAPGPEAPSEPAAQDKEMDAKLEASVRAASLGVQTATQAAYVLQQLVSVEPLDRRDVREVANLASAGVDIARKNAKELHGMTKLPEGERSEAQRAVDKLEEAHTSIRRIERQVGAVEHIFHKHQAENVLKDATELHAELGDASVAIDSIASAHNITLGTPERSAARAE